jgi:hypothetical protein
MRWRPRDRLKFVVFTLPAVVVIACGVAAALVLAGAGDGPGSRGPHARLREALLRVLALKRRYGLLR